MADSDPQPPRESTMRRAGVALGNDRLHKTMNWTTLLGVAGTAVLGYVADANRGETQEKIASGAATELAAFQEWKDSAQADMKSQAEQIARLREAVAALKAANELMAQGYGQRPIGARVRAAVEDVDELLEQQAVVPAPPPESADAPAGKTQNLKRKLLGQ